MTKKEQDDERIFIDFKPNDFVIRISPVLDQDDEWTGELNVGYMAMDENYMNDLDYQHLDMVTNMAISTLPLSEEDMEFRNKLYEYTVNALSAEQDGKSKVTTEKVDDNVVKLNFN